MFEMNKFVVVFFIDKPNVEFSRPTSVKLLTWAKKLYILGYLFF